MNRDISKKRLGLFSGKDDFYDIRVHCDVMVDKSLFIQEIIENDEGATLITRPRRSGKTLNLDMLKKFLAIEVDQYGNKLEPNPNLILFSGGILNTAFAGNKTLEPLAIAKANGGAYLNNQGQHPVIFISLADVKGKSFAEIYDLFSQKISALYLKNEYLYTHLNSLGGLSMEVTSAKFKKIAEKESSINDLMESLLFLSNLLHDYYNKKVYRLVDEYDKPVNFLLEQEFTYQNRTLVEEVTLFITSTLSPCGKNNNVVEKIILTGIFDTLKKEGNSGFNNVNVYGITDAGYSKSFGFSQEEINQMIKRLQFGANEDLVKNNLRDWYNGYAVPVNSTHNIQIYTPWAVIKYLKKAYDGDFEPENYWPQTGSSSILQHLIKMEMLDKESSQRFSAITRDNEVELKFNKADSLFRFDLTNRYSEELISYLLVSSGYLTVRKDEGRYFFRIPNYEVEREFIDVIQYELISISNVINVTTDKMVLKISQEEESVLKKHLKILKTENHLKQASMAILSGDNAKLLNLIPSLTNDNGVTKCEYKGYNFFHFVAISGDKKTYPILIDQCNNTLLSIPDVVHMYKPIDYAFLLQNHDIITLMEENGENASLLVEPGFLNSMYCNDLSHFLTSAIMTATSKYYGKDLLTYALCTPYTVAIGIVCIRGYSKNLKDYLDTDICNHYDYYHGIKQNSLLGFQKQIIENNAKYVAIGKNCNDGSKKVQELIFTDLKLEEENVVFSLCMPVQNYDPKEDSPTILSILGTTIFIGALLAPAIIFPNVFFLGGSADFDD